MAADRTYVVVVKRSTCQNRQICLVGGRSREVVAVQGLLKREIRRGEFEVVVVQRWSPFEGGR